MKTSFAESAGSHNLALLSDAERQAIEQHKADCLSRYQLVKNTAQAIYSGMQKHGRMWAERKITEHKDIDEALRLHLNLLMRARK